MPENFVQGNVAYNSKLAPEAWIDSGLRREVRYKLLKAAQMFIDTLDINNFKLYDIVLTGSMANYNYTRYSDFDVHVVTKYSELDCDNLAEAFYSAKKKIWNNDHDIIVRGHEVELYVEDLDQPPVAAGIYSLLDNVWIKQPSYDPPTIADLDVNVKVLDLIKQIQATIEGANEANDIRRLLYKLRNMRQSGLERHGEYGVENLSYKILRNLGYLDKLSKAIKDQQDLALSL